MTWSHIVFINARLLAMPVVLMADYSHDTVPLVTTIGDVRNVETVIFFTALLLFSGYSFAQSLRSAPACLLALSLLAAPFIPCSNLLFPVGFVVAERVLYLPSIGFCLLLAIALHSLLPPRIAPHSLALIVAAYSVRTFLRNHDWSTKERFFQAMVRDNPLGPKGHYGLGVTIHHSRDKEKAESGVWHLKEATRLQPNYYDAYSDLGAHFNAKGEYEKAAEYFEGAIQIKPEHIQGISNLGLNYLNVGACHVSWRCLPVRLLHAFLSIAYQKVAPARMPAKDMTWRYNPATLTHWQGRNYGNAFEAHDTALQLLPGAKS
jgi:hypothetical protein